MAVATETLLDRRIADPKFGEALEALVPRYVTAIVRQNVPDIYKEVTLGGALMLLGPDKAQPIDFKAPLILASRDRRMLSGLEDASWKIVTDDYQGAIADLTSILPKKGELEAGVFNRHNQEALVHTVSLATQLRGFLSDDELSQAFATREGKLTQNRAVQEFLRGMVLGDRRRIWKGLGIFAQHVKPYRDREDFEERFEKQYANEALSSNLPSAYPV